jgi:hypothetical protein
MLECVFEKALVEAERNPRDIPAEESPSRWGGMNCDFVD